MKKIGIIGATGYTGAELVRILTCHEGVELTFVSSRQYAGKAFTEIYPAFTGHTDLVCEPYGTENLPADLDLVFTALPHKIPMEIIPPILAKKIKVVDLSADFRFKNLSTYETHYQPHSAKELVPQAVYGLSEIYRDKIKTASLVGNPGCYPTSTLLPLLPLIYKDMLDVGTIIIDSKSGVSGAGRSATQTTHFCEVNESFKAYKVTGHRHTPEIAEILSREAQVPVDITFVPHLLPATRGMLSTIYVNLKAPTSAEHIFKVLSNYYKRSPFVRIHETLIPDILHVRGTNHCDIGFRVDLKGKRLILVSVIDNLVKGASGQAVQNMNIMLGMDETMGLRQIPLPL